MLAWGHARVIENLMLQKHRMNPPPVRAISDQFASNKDVVAKALMSLGREIELVQKHRAEEDLAVAAASILARNEFVTRLGALEKQFEIELPKGASAAVDAAAKEFVAKHGSEDAPPPLVLVILSRCMPVPQLLKAHGQGFQFLVRQILNINHEIVCPPQRTDYFIQLEVDRFGVAILRVLNQKNHKERDHGRSRVHHELPGIGKVKVWSGECPQHNRAQREREGPLGPYPVRSLGREDMETFCP